MSDYRVKLTEKQIYALFDIAMGYNGEDSPSRDGRTRAALTRRGLIAETRVRGSRSFHLTMKGRAYLPAVRWENNELEEENAVASTA